MKWILTLMVTAMIGIVVLAACKGNVYSLKVGDCYNGPLLSTEEHIEITDVEVVNCDDPHTNEVYALFELPDSSWKGNDYVYEQANKICAARYEAFMGIEYDLSTWWFDIVAPTEESWKEVDDRLVQCSVTEESGMQFSGSAKGSRR